MITFNRVDDVTSPKIHRSSNEYRRSKTRHSMLWFLPVPIFGIMGFFFILVGIVVISTSKSGSSKVNVTTGIILLVSGGVMWGLCFFFLCSSPYNCASPKTRQDEVLPIAYPQTPRSSFDAINPSMPLVDEEFFRNPPAPSRKGSFYPLVTHGAEAMSPYPFGRIVPTAPEVPLYPCLIATNGAPALQNLPPEEEAALRRAILNNPQIPLSLILSSSLNTHPRVSI